jgi:hypothetical protein
LCQDRDVLAIHGPVQVSRYGRSNVAIGPDSLAVVRSPYDVGDLGERFVVVLIGGILASAAANSLWPGHLDVIGAALGIVILAALLPLLVTAAIAFVRAVAGTVSAVARPRRTIREARRQVGGRWRGPHTHGITDYLAVHDPKAIRIVLDTAEVHEVTEVRGWLRPTLELTLRSGQVHRVTAHPWWRRRLTGLAKQLRELGAAA